MLVAFYYICLTFNIIKKNKMKPSQLHTRLLNLFPKEQVFTDELSRLTKGTDASLYRLIPKAVVRVHSEEEVMRLLRFCHQEEVPVTFKAAGTSLSGQTISDSILMETGRGFEFSTITDNGHTATFGCGLTGGAANLILKRYQRKLGPKPASIQSAKIGGIVANNASGSSYGILHNSYNTVKSMRVILADGTLLDTGDKESCQRFLENHPDMVASLIRLHEEATGNKEIRATIQRKFELKNTCGYGVNSLVDAKDPIEMVRRLMIGSEGTLGFISQVTFHTVHDAPLKAAAMVYFATLRDVCNAILPLRDCPVSAAELMDRNALRAVENQEGMPPEIKDLPEGAAALLIDTSADDEDTLVQQMAMIEAKLEPIGTLYPVRFTRDKQLYERYWRVRDGLFTSAAAARPPQTACIIEDVAFRGEVLGDALTDLRALLKATDYDDAVMWGHLLDGNVHFTVFPDINTSEGISNYASFMHALSELTVTKYDGSLKAEHGTGRNMAPFVEKEWGSEVYHLMKRIKQAFDPKNILNPGVVINNDPEVFIQNMKRVPDAHPIIDKCIECGFCEVSCPSKNLTLTPRQRIVAYRYIANSVANKADQQSILREIKKISYPMDETCATDGLCGIACPVNIDTGMLVKELRWQQNGKVAHRMAHFIADHMGSITSMVRGLLPVPHAISKVVGYNSVESVTKGLHKVSNGLLPLWTRHTPTSSKKIASDVYPSMNPKAKKVVYFPACVTRMMGGPSSESDYKEDVPTAMLSLLRKGGYTVITPQNRNKLCCGMAFSSKGFKEQAKKKERELNEALLSISENGELPVVFDMSPCLLHAKEKLDPNLKLYDQVEFIHDFLLDKLTIEKLPITVATHTTCSSTKMKLGDKLQAIAARCTEKVVVPDDVRCCGWAGDRGFFYPELNQSALEPLKEGVAAASQGLSNSRTCEIGLTMNSEITYQSIVHLVNRASRG